jgi:hypothetical protein
MRHTSKAPCVSCALAYYDQNDGTQHLASPSTLELHQQLRQYAIDFFSS